MNTFKQTGFTLVELMVVIAILVVIVTVGVPNLQSFILNNRLLSQTNLLMVSVKTARSEAMTQRANVSLCQSDNGTSCGGSWSDGHVAFLDADADGVVDAGEQVIISNVLESTGIDLNFSGGSFVTFDRRGRAVGTSGTMTFCDDRGSDYARAIVIDPIGRSKPYTGTITCPGAGS